MTGGVFNDQGEFYLKTHDGIYLYYNFSDGKYTIGDGQGLDFRPARTKQPLEEFLMRCLANEMVYFDVGANNGYYYALKVAKNHPGCSVYAFEPDPRIFHHLTKNVAINQAGRVAAIREALSDHVGLARMTALLGASNFLIPEGGTTDQNTIDVKCTTLDAFVTRNRIQRIDWIKVDIEGGEPVFLHGSSETLQRFKPVMIMELNPALLTRNGSSVEEVTSSLTELGYECLHVKDSADAIAIPREKLSLLTKTESSWLEGSLA
jgi:FkbM family methyltransferase